MDELNHAISGAERSRYTSPLHELTAANFSFGGGDGNIFDSTYGYRDEYAKIWCKT